MEDETMGTNRSESYMFGYVKGHEWAMATAKLAGMPISRLRWEAWATKAWIEYRFPNRSWHKHSRYREELENAFADLESPSPQHGKRSPLFFERLVAYVFGDDASPFEAWQQIFGNASVEDRNWMIRYDAELMRGFIDSLFKCCRNHKAELRQRHGR